MSLIGKSWHIMITQRLIDHVDVLNNFINEAITSHFAIHLNFTLIDIKILIIKHSFNFMFVLLIRYQLLSQIEPSEVTLKFGNEMNCVKLSLICAHSSML